MGDMKQAIVFSIGDSLYGIEIEKVSEILEMQKITRLPNCPDTMEGVIDLRKQVHTVMNLRALLNLPNKDADANTKIIITSIAKMGIIVDSVSEVLSFDESQVVKMDDLDVLKRTGWFDYLIKVDGKFVTVLNLEKAFEGYLNGQAGESSFS